MNHVKIRTDQIKSTVNLLRPKEGTYVVFKKGTISIEYWNNIVLSMKSPLGFFEGALLGDLFADLQNLRNEYSYFGTSNHMIKIKSGSEHHGLYFRSLEYDDVGIDLWSPSINWHPCCQDIVKGICRVASLIFGSTRSLADPENLALSSIHVVDGHVIAVKEISFRASRYKLSTQSPFNFSISPIGLNQVFNRIKKRKILRLGQAEIQNDAKVRKAMIFDFGDIRIGVPEAEVNEQSTFEGDLRGGPIYYGRNRIISVVNNFFMIPCEFIITIPPNLRKFRFQAKGMEEDDNFITLHFMKRRIFVRLQTKIFSASDKALYQNTLAPKHRIRIQVNHKYFRKALVASRLMGLIKTSRGDLLLYFKNKAFEHLLWARKYIEEED